MAITVNYGSMSDALALADRAGRGINQQRQHQADMEYMNMIDQMQKTADARRANDMQLALEANNASSQRQQQMNQFNVTVEPQPARSGDAGSEVPQRHGAASAAARPCWTGSAAGRPATPTTSCSARRRRVGDNNATKGAGTSQWQTEQYQVRRELDQMEAAASATRTRTCATTQPVPPTCRTRRNPKAKDGHAAEYDMAAARVAESEQDRVKELTNRSTQLSPVTPGAPAPALATPAPAKPAGPAQPGDSGRRRPPPFPDAWDAGPADAAGNADAPRHRGRAGARTLAVAGGRDAAAAAILCVNNMRAQVDRGGVGPGGRSPRVLSTRSSAPGRTRCSTPSPDKTEFRGHGQLRPCRQPGTLRFEPNLRAGGLPTAGPDQPIR
jgi:hypothetical protein